MKLEILIVTGQSGSGKSTAVRAFEDQGYYVVDNLPTSMIDELIRVLERDEQHRRLVLVLDVRNRRSLQEGPSLIERLRTTHDPVRVIYLEASESTLLRRYSETRRLHPLDLGQGLRDSLSEERELLTPMREIADDTYDTSDISPHELKARLTKSLPDGSERELRIEVKSFGFKHGVPLDADMLLDVRFLPNPYFEPALRESTGLEVPVAQFVLNKTEAKEFLERAEQLLEFLIPQYQLEGKRYFTLAIGCTGGRHRSVALSRRIADGLEKMGHQVAVRHRDLQEKRS